MIGSEAIDPRVPFSLALDAVEVPGDDDWSYGEGFGLSTPTLGCEAFGAFAEVRCDRCVRLQAELDVAELVGSRWATIADERRRQVEALSGL